MVNVKSQSSIDEATGLLRYGYTETRFLIYLCNHLHEKQASMLDSEFMEYLSNPIQLRISDLANSVNIDNKEARRIFSHADKVFNRDIENGTKGIWFSESDYWNGLIELKVSEHLAKLLLERNSFLYCFPISQIKKINCIYAIRFVNYLYAHRYHKKVNVEIELTLDEIRSIYGIKDQYSCLSNIRSKVIGHSIAIINQQTKFKIYIERKKSGYEESKYKFMVQCLDQRPMYA